MTKISPEIKASAEYKAVRKKVRISWAIFWGILALWIVALVIVGKYYLDKFNGFLIKYQSSYEASRPELAMDKFLTVYTDGDVDTIYGLLSEKPVINNFEGEEQVKAFMSELLVAEDIHYAKAEGYSESIPKYYVIANDFVISTVTLARSQTESLEYGFPVWDISSVEYYIEPQRSIRFFAPSNVIVSINGIPVEEDKYCYYTCDVSDEQVYFGDYGYIPRIKRYLVEDFYQQPEITAITDMACETDIVFNENTGIYEISFGTPPFADELQQLAIDTVISYCKFISNDLSIDLLKKLFVKDSEILQLVYDGRQEGGAFFAKHTSIDYENIEIGEFYYYNDEAFSCEVIMDQVINNGKSSNVKKIDTTFYFVKEEGSWKAVWFRF